MVVEVVVAAMVVVMLASMVAVTVVLVEIAMVVITVYMELELTETGKGIFKPTASRPTD